MLARFPHSSAIKVSGGEMDAREITERLSPYLSERRRLRIEEVVRGRTYSVVPVLEGVHDLGNVNAVMRSAEGLGFGATHLAALQGDAAEWATNKVDGAALDTGLGIAKRQSQGADKWVDVHVWKDSRQALDNLRTAGYRIIATYLDADAVPIGEVDFREPTAVIFGNEAEGVSEVALAEADLHCVLPIDGFIQSYNISVAAALTLYHARQDRLARQGFHGDLTVEQREILTAVYYLRAIKNAEAILR